MGIIKQIFCNHKWAFGTSPTFKHEWRNIETQYICKKCGKESWQSKTCDKLWEKAVKERRKNN